MMYFLTFLLFVHSLIELSVEFKDLPSYFPRCHRLDPNLADCWLRASNETRQYVIKGIPEINIPPVDPLNVPKVSFGNSELTNVEVRGLGNYVFNYYNFDLEKMRLHIKGAIGNLDFSGDYTISGHLMLAPIEGNGKFTAGIDDCKVESIRNLKIVQKNGEDYLSTVSSNMTINSVSKPRLHFDGLFGGNKEIGDITNQAIQDNIEELFAEFKPSFERVIGSIVDNLLFKNIDDNIPFDKLYPNIP